MSGSIEAAVERGIGDEYQPGQPEANKLRAQGRIRRWWRGLGHASLPTTVLIAGLGRTLADYTRWTMQREPPPEIAGSQVWTVNRGMHAISHDQLFVMDYLEGEEAQFPHYGKALRAYKRPIITSVRQEGFNSHAYPLADVSVYHGGMATAGYLHNSIPYLLALLPPLGVTSVTLWGCDYVTEDGRTLEYGLANVEYWCGVLRANGLSVGRPSSSQLLGGSKPEGWIYGYPHNRLSTELLAELSELEQLRNTHKT